MLISRSIAGCVLGVALVGAAPKEPAALRRLPVELRDRATVVVKGRYVVGRGACQLLPNGTRRWPLLRGFMTQVVYRGEVRADYIGVSDPHLWSARGPGRPLEFERDYLVLIRPSKRTEELLKQPEGSRRYQDALEADEVLAIVEP